MSCLALVGLGLAVSGYLLARTFTLLSNSAPDAIDVCSALFGAGCDEALLNPISWKLGIPLAGWGVTYYATLACLLILGWALDKAFDLEASVGALLLAVAGACGSVILATIVVFGKAPFCPLCMVVHAINLTLVLAIKHASGRTVAQLVQALGAAWRYILGAPTEAPVEARWKVVGFVTTALVAVVLYQWVLVQSERRAATAGGALEPTRVLAAYASTTRQEVPIGPEDPRLGLPDAPVRLVVFSSFQCPGCRTFAADMRHLADRFHDDLTIVFKHYPLGTACNEALRIDMHPRACEAAWAAEAAHGQGRFWRFHDALFATGLGADEDTIQRVVMQIGLDSARFEAGRHAPTVLAKVRSDVELGIRLGVDSTPAVFLNERRIPRVSLRELQVIIEHELRSHGE